MPVTTRRRASSFAHAGQAAMGIEIPRRASLQLPPSWSIEAGLDNDVCPSSHRQTVADDGSCAASLLHARVINDRPWPLFHGPSFESDDYVGLFADAAFFDDVLPGNLPGASSLLRGLSYDDVRLLRKHGLTYKDIFPGTVPGSSFFLCGLPFEDVRPGNLPGTSSLLHGLSYDDVRVLRMHGLTYDDIFPGTVPGTLSFLRGLPFDDPFDDVRPGNLPGTSSLLRGRTVGGEREVNDGGGFLHDYYFRSIYSPLSLERFRRRTAAGGGLGTSSLSRRRTVTSEAGSAHRTAPGGHFELDMLGRPGTLSPPLYALDGVYNVHMSRSRHASPDEGAAPSQIRFSTLVDMSALLPSRADQNLGDPDPPRRRHSALVDLEAQITPPSAYLPESVVTGEQKSATQWRARYWAGFFTLSFVLFASLALDPRFTGSTRAAFAVVATTSWAGLTTVLDRAFPVFKNTDMIGLWFVFGALLASLLAWQSFKENNVHAAT